MMPVVINKNSGTVLRLGEENVESQLRAALPGRIGKVLFLEGGEIGPALQGLRSENANGLLVGGGDGSAVCAAETLGKAGVPFGVLPLGTMNLLARDLGAAATFGETLARLGAFVPDRIDAGLVNGRTFLCSAVIGFVPEGALAREAMRDDTGLETVVGFLGTMARGIGGDIRHVLNLKSRPEDAGRTLETTSLVIANNSFIRHPSEAGHRFFRQSLKDGKLAVYSAAPRDMMDGLTMALSVLQGDWQDHDSIRSFETTGLVVETANRTELVSLDGEPVELQTPLHFTVSCKSIPVLRMELKD